MPRPAKTRAMSQANQNEQARMIRMVKRHDCRAQAMRHGSEGMSGLRRAWAGRPTAGSATEPTKGEWASRISGGTTSAVPDCGPPWSARRRQACGETTEPALVPFAPVAGTTVNRNPTARTTYHANSAKGLPVGRGGDPADSAAGQMRNAPNHRTDPFSDPFSVEKGSVADWMKDLER